MTAAFACSWPGCGNSWSKTRNAVEGRRRWQGKRLARFD
jgi:hypothetical protein